MKIKLTDKMPLSQGDDIFFVSAKYLNTLNGIKFICFVDGKNIVKYVPLEIKKRSIFRIGRLVYEPLPNYDEKDMDMLIAFLKKQKIIDFLLPTPNYIPFKLTPKGALYCDFGSYRVDLNLSQDELFANLHSKHRNVIKKAQKANLQIAKNSLQVVDDCFNMFQETMRRSKMDYPLQNHLRSLFEKMPENIYCATISQDGVVHGAIYLYYTLERAYYMYGGSLLRPYTGAMNYLHWDAMVTLKSTGVQSYDFVGARIEPEKGSKLEGIQRFKERFGGDLYKGYMWKYIFNKPKYHLYVLLLKLLALKNKTTYKGDIIDQENSR
jgi:hypothetical protein